MKKLFLILSSIAQVFLSQAQGPNLQWAKNIGGTYNVFGYSVAVDLFGNVYTTGKFGGIADFDPGLGTFTLTPAGNPYYADIFISKLDASGNFVWAKNIGEINDDIGLSIAVDVSGNVYTTGFFEGTADFDPGAGTYTLSSAGGNDIFISKLDASGNFMWAKSMGGAMSDAANCLAIDGSGNVYTTGYFMGTADFDPGVGTFNLITASGHTDIFISKIDAFGNFVWAKNIGGILNGYWNYYGNSTTVDLSGNVYITGCFMGTADFDTGAGIYTLTAVGNNDIFLLKLDAAGNFVWAKNMGGTSNAVGNSIAVDPSGNVCTTGFFMETVDFDPGAGTFNLTSAGIHDVFISKLDASGNFMWAKSIGGTYVDIGNSIQIDASGNVYTTGRFWGTADFDSGAGTFTLTPGVGFILKLDASGNFIWANNVGGSSIDLDSSGNIYTTGTFYGTADFDPGPGIFNLTTGGGNDVFIHKMSQCSPLNPSITAITNSSLICIGESATLTAGGANTYSWSNGGTGATQIISPSITTIYVVTGMDGSGCSNIGMVYQVVDPCVGINPQQPAHNELKVYPNPSNSVIHVEASVLNGHDDLQIQVTNAFGQIVLNENIKKDRSSYNITHLPAGIYFITLKQNASIKTVKMIKE